MKAELLIDNSAWARLWDPSLPTTRADEIADDFDAGRLAVSLPFLLEAGFSARSARHHAEINDDLDALEPVPIDADVELRARTAQQQLARAGHHRMPPSDLILAAIADRHGLGILHYDNDFEVLLEKTDLEFGSVWLMPRGSL
ncbi:MAG: hypothetical protein QOI84_41 [Solirubrobacterales bacterium]|jgi:predicted nucleic acid-binding protein|nr:hypothetical protein [Solirubrobacterales bacterium]